MIGVAPNQSFLPLSQVTRTPKEGYMGKLSNSTSTLYTAPSLTSPAMGTSPCTAALRSINVVNTDTVDRTYTIYVVVSAGSASDGNVIFKDVTIASKTTHYHAYDQDAMPLADGATVQGVADVANKVTVRVCVEELTY